jgi:hypothetical protein
MMVKKKKKFRRNKRRRNAAPIAVTTPLVVTTPRRRARLPRRGSPPDWKTTLAALLGGAGSAALGGLVVNQQVLSPEAVGIGMIGLGGATAYFADGNTRVVGNSVAAAGAGQLALALMAKRALGSDKPPAVAPQPATSAPQLPAPAPAPRKSATGGGVVIDLFRDAARELDELEEDEWRFGTRDAEAAGIDVESIDPDEVG